MMGISPVGIQQPYNLTICHEDKPWLLPQQQHDQFIMEALTDLSEATKK
jgi:hypothetical protein